MPNSCKELRDALAACLQQSDCVMVQRNRAADCLRPPLSDTLPKECLQLKRGFGECKRGLVDMRKRFRGNTPAAYGKIQKADDSGAGYQLYGGKTAFGSGVKSTDGNEVEEDWRELENLKYRAELAKKSEGSKA
ncbi:related to PET191 protein, involved in assembly of cytochrome oxidase [Cephalotrichum gorgonifer]|uniref:Related to PET191 protein, involved in assembly of cytochrome oxidase n=1 Tax=Cephalotrichum gorgonifer TaxID=2041049 RepID=A0AAE8SSY6_9PEZI|nr:related to PET191 protein, involved in assembly of cytochrome oxidase [Cephalotrichum gorgonifer]